MDTLNRWLVAHRRTARVAWFGLLVVLAACNGGDGNGGGGADGGGGGDGGDEGGDEGGY